VTGRALVKVDDTIWRRVDGRERVTVRRIWFWPGQGWTVRAHPIRGGKPLVADQQWFLEHFAKDDGP
jgi:hypothetical protein